MILYFVCGFLGIFYAELVGYLVHSLLHSGNVLWLHKMHMNHHINLYPFGNLRSENYRTPKHSRFLGLGIEWIFPVTLVLLFTILFLIVFGADVLRVMLFAASALVWASIFFSYMHDQFHLKSSLLLKGGLLRAWFSDRRELHDLHHLNMKKNYGITFFLFDRIFGTFGRLWEEKFNEEKKGG